jgi:Cys-rich four helix bundle protein (predicted Tat secretion target)
MDRRTILKGAGVLAAATFGMQANAEHEHHQMGAHPNQKIIDTASDCMVKGEICVAHCLVLLGDGDKPMAACAQSVNQMLSVCTALKQLAIQESSHLKEMAKIAAQACKECEAECKKHADKHDVCKNCLEACKACRKECEALTA